MKDKFKVIISFLFVFLAFIFIDDVYADSINISFSSNNDFTFNTPSKTIKLTRRDWTNNFNNYHAFSGEMINSTGASIYTANLYNMNSINVSNYDYALIQVCSFGKYPSTVTFVDHSVYGYSVSTTSMNWDDDTTTGVGSNYCSLIKIDTSTSSTIGGYLQIQFSIGISTQVNSSLYLNKVMYLGKNGDDVITSLNQQTNAINNVNSSIGQTNNKLDSVNSAIGNTNNKLDETNDYIKDDTAPSSDISVLGNVQGIFPPGPVDSLLNIPFQFLSVLTSSFGGVCVPMSGTFVFDSTLTLPCFSEVFYSNVPAALMVFINTIPSAFILIKYFKHLYKKVDRAVNMNANADDEWGVL